MATGTQQGFLLNEDKALKTLLSDIKVWDNMDRDRPSVEGRSVKVYFRLPEDEQQEVNYPFITIENINVSEAFERSHRGTAGLGYTPDGITLQNPDAEWLTTPWPIPYDLDYQITTHARFALHDRFMVAALFQGALPSRFGYLIVEEDQTVRRLDMVGYISSDTRDQNRKRLFRKIFSVRVSSELLVDGVSEPVRVEKIITTIKANDTSPEIVEAIGE